MSSMFLETENANPNTSGWDTSSVINMEGMFANADVANPDTSGWNTSSVTNMRDMFYGALVADPDTSGWDFSSVTDYDSWIAPGRMFFGSGLTTPNYDKLLISLDATATTSATIDVGSLPHTSASSAAKARLETDGWSFTDGGSI